MSEIKERAGRPVFVVLLHSPMVDRTGKEVTTAVTNLDIHDIARTCTTYGIAKYFIVNPEPGQEKLVNVILDHWREEVAKVHHPSRAVALESVQFLRTFQEAFNEAFVLAGGKRPFVVMPDARDLTRDFPEKFKDSWSYEDLRRRYEADEFEALMIVFGTGWGISPSFFGQVDHPLKPLRRASGGREYNHLSVRAAAAIVLDRVLGARN